MSSMSMTHFFSCRSAGLIFLVIQLSLFECLEPSNKVKFLWNKSFYRKNYSKIHYESLKKSEKQYVPIFEDGTGTRTWIFQWTQIFRVIQIAEFKYIFLRARKIFQRENVQKIFAMFATLAKEINGRRFTNFVRSSIEFEIKSEQI